MYKKIISKQAKLEYAWISEYIAKDNMFYANKVLSKIDESIDLLLEYPFIWKKIIKNHRIIVEPNYRFKVIYRIEWDIIYIVSIFKYKDSWN